MEYPDDKAQVEVVVFNLKGEVAELVINLHSEGAPELADTGHFSVVSENNLGTPCKPDEWRQSSTMSDRGTAPGR